MVQHISQYGLAVYQSDVSRALWYSSSVWKLHLAAFCKLAGSFSHSRRNSIVPQEKVNQFSFRSQICSTISWHMSIHRSAWIPSRFPGQNNGGQSARNLSTARSSSSSFPVQSSPTARTARKSSKKSGRVFFSAGDWRYSLTLNMLFLRWLFCSTRMFVYYKVKVCKYNRLFNMLAFSFFSIFF